MFKLIKGKTEAEDLVRRLMKFEGEFTVKVTHEGEDGGEETYGITASRIVFREIDIQLKEEQAAEIRAMEAA